MSKKKSGGIPNPFPDYNMGHILRDLFFRRKDGGFFIEAGATNGVAGSICYILEDAFKWTGINVEANKYWIEGLKKNRPKCINIHGALWDKKGTETLVLPQHRKNFRYAGGASFVMWDKERLEREKFECTEELEVETFTYHDMCKKHKVEHVDLFVLDVEGAELHVLDGIKKSDPLPEFFYMETNKLDELELCSRMGSLGYTALCENASNTVYKKGKHDKLARQFVEK